MVQQSAPPIVLVSAPHRTEALAGRATKEHRNVVTYVRPNVSAGKLRRVAELQRRIWKILDPTGRQNRIEIIGASHIESGGMRPTGKTTRPAKQVDSTHSHAACIFRSFAQGARLKVYGHNP
jgi:hypothetical protein